MKLIDKDKVVAEVKKRIKGLKDCHADTVAGYAGEISGLERLLSFLDTLEVKEIQEEPTSNELKIDACWENKYKEVLKQIRAQIGE